MDVGAAVGHCAEVMSAVVWRTTPLFYLTVSPVINAKRLLVDSPNALGTVRARLGYLPTPNLLAFVTGGFAYGEVEQSGSYTTADATLGTLVRLGYGYDCSANVPCFSGSASDTAFGGAAGGGLEYAIAKNWTIRGEYLYVSLAGKSVIETATALPAGTTIPSSFTANFGRTNLNIVRAALNYRF